MNTSGNLLCSWPSGQELSQLQQMESLYFPRPWTLEQWHSLVDSHHYIYRWMHHDKPVGFSLFSHVNGDETAHLLKICLIPEQRGTGASIAFWNELIAKLRANGVANVFLEVEESNLRALNFYKKIGFNTLRTVRGYYSDGENAVVMLLTLRAREGLNCSFD